jgi:hypothetical protein
MSSRTRATWAPLGRPPFLICLAVLGAAALAAGPGAKAFRAALIKEAIPCRKPLCQMDRDSLGPYRFLQASTLPGTFLAALGTDNYLSWLVEDSRADRGSPVRYAYIFVTYDTGKATLVPHTPDVCMRGAGYEPKQAHENKTIPVAALAPGETEVPVRVLTFVKSDVCDREELTVIYTFHCNGQFTASRTRVRQLINNPLDRYAYFSKVEVSFSGRPTGQGGASREESVEAARDLLNYLLPVLRQDHYPDWEAVRREGQGA